MPASSKAMSGGVHRVTLAQVAAQAKVSVSTVSAVLNKRRHCWASAETCERVIAAAADLGYRPNPAARSLRYGTTGAIGLITTSLDVEITTRRIQAIEHAAREPGYHVAMSFDANDADMEDHLINYHRQRGVDGFVVFPTAGGEHKALEQLVTDRIPVVMADSHGRLPFACDDVSSDYEMAGRMQAAHLIDHGRQQLAILTTNPLAHINHVREQAIRDHAEVHGVAPPIDLEVVWPENVGSQNLEPLYPQVEALLAEIRGKVDGIIAFDMLASLAVRAAHVLDITVPDELAIIGMDDAIVASHCRVPLTTIALRPEEFGERVVDFLRQRLMGEEGLAPRAARIQPYLIQRQSTPCA